MTAGTPRLILISGHIASGKTSVARRLADIAQERGLRAAALDMDDIVVSLAGDWSRAAEYDRHLAGEVTALVLDRLFASGMEVVTVAGTTLAGGEWENLQHELKTTVDAVRARLLVSLAESQRRAQADTTRLATRDPEVVELLYLRVDEANMPTVDLELSTDGLTLEQVAQSLAAQVLQAGE
jgi:chloramphenicol 3-O-phosphotransferase